jgi:glycosyltransferase involved in cell wall biosynthesis
MKPVLFVTGHAPPDRVGAFRELHARENIELALFGGRSLHGPAAPAPPLDVPHRHVRQQELAQLAASGAYRAVVLSTGGRMALPAVWAGGRRAGVPLILWASLWAHPRSAAHAFSYPLLLRLYRSADAVVTYGPHVSAYVRARGARNVHVAPQSVDNAFWRDPGVVAPDERRWPAGVGVVMMFGGRAAREKGVGVLLQAWRASGLTAPAAALVLVGVGSTPRVPAGGAVQNAKVSTADGGAHVDAPDAKDGVTHLDTVAATDDVVCLDPVDAVQMRNFYAASDVLVLPSIRTRTFREPWGLVVNEAMNRQLPVIVSDAVGAAAGGLVRDGRNGLVVPAGNPAALAAAMRRLAGDAQLRARLGAAGASDVLAYNYKAWAEGFSRALASVGASASVETAAPPTPSEDAGSVRRS